MIGVMIFVCTFMYSVQVDAFSISASSGQVNEGGSFTVSFGSGTTGKYSISVSNGSASSSEVWSEGGGSVSVTASGAGTTTVTVTAVDVTDSSYNLIGGSQSVSVSVASSTPEPTPETSTPSTPSSSTSSSSNNTDDDEPEESSNTNLSDLTISEGTISPEFEPATTEYDAQVLDVNVITITATAADDKATVTGDGEQELVLGDNTFEIIVTAENGHEKTYTLKVFKDESPSVFLAYGEMELGVVKDISDVLPPANFEETTVTINGEEVVAWESPLIGKTILYMMDAEGNKGWYVYEEDGISPFLELGLLGKNIFVVEIPEEEQAREGMIFQEVTVSGNQLYGWAFEDPAFEGYYVIRVISETGETVEYLYYMPENAMIINPNFSPITEETFAQLTQDSATYMQERDSVKSENQQLKLFLMIALGVSAVLLILLIVVFVLLKKKGKRIANGEYDSSIDEEELEDADDIEVSEVSFEEDEDEGFVLNQIEVSSVQESENDRVQDRDGIQVDKTKKEKKLKKKNKQNLEEIAEVESYEIFDTDDED